jgi:hypothetical protein
MCRPARVVLADSRPFYPLYSRPDCSSDWCVLFILGWWFSAVLLGPGGGLISLLPAAGALTLVAIAVISAIALPRRRKNQRASGN